MTRPADIYFRFLKLAEAIRGLPSLPSLDPLEERILSVIATREEGEGGFSVTALIGRSDLGSPATLHARLKSMRKKGWIVLADTADARRKQIALTAQALEHFDTLSEALRKASGSSP